MESRELKEELVLVVLALAFVPKGGSTVFEELIGRQLRNDLLRVHSVL